MRQKSKKSGQAEGFTFRREWAIKLEVLNEKQRSQVLKGMLMYYLYKVQVSLNGRAEFVYNCILSDMEKDLGKEFVYGNYGREEQGEQ